MRHRQGGARHVGQVTISTISTNIYQYLQYLHTRDGFLSEAPLEGYIDLLVARVSFYASWIQVKLLQNLGISTISRHIYIYAPGRAGGPPVQLLAPWLLQPPLLRVGAEAELRAGGELLRGRGGVRVHGARARGRGGGRLLRRARPLPGGGALGRRGRGPGGELAKSTKYFYVLSQIFSPPRPRCSTRCCPRCSSGRGGWRRGRRRPSTRATGARCTSRRSAGARAARVTCH